MAEQYQSFQGKEPNIDVDLFNRARESGIRQGNALPTPLTAAIRGAEDGLKLGTYIKSAQASAKAQEAENEVNTDPNVIEAHKNQEIAKGTEARLQNEVLTNNEETARLQMTADLENKALISQQGLEDTKNKRVISQAISTRQPGNYNAILQDPSFTGTLSRDNNTALQFLASAKANGADPTLVDNAYKQFDAVEQQKMRAQQLQQETELKQRAKIAREEKASDAVAAVDAYPGITALKYTDSSQTQISPDFNYQKLKVYDKSKVNIVDGQLDSDPITGTVITKNPVMTSTGPSSYVLAYGRDVIDPNIEHTEGLELQKHLDVYKQYGAINKWPTNNSAVNQAPQVPTGNELPTTGTGLASGNASPQPVPTPLPPGAVNQNIVDAAAKRNASYFQSAQTQGRASSYQALLSQGQQLARAKTMPAPDYITTPQSTPVPQGTPAITIPLPQVTPVPGAAPVGTVEHGQDRLSKVMGGADVTLNVARFSKPVVTNKTVDKINAIPAATDLPALLKGQIAVESAGNPAAINDETGSAGLFQFMQSTAEDLGLSPEDRKDPEKAGPAAIKYLSQTYDQIKKETAKTLSEQGVPIEPDPRFILAGWNGGTSWITRGIRAGNTTWDSMKQYLIANKSSKAEKENIEYVDRVITASIPFIKGGNASDDSYIQALRNFGIINVG